MSLTYNILGLQLLQHEVHKAYLRENNKANMFNTNYVYDIYT